MDLVIEKFPDEAHELILLAPLIFDKARQVRRKKGKNQKKEKKEKA
jgi:hypothetical protein